MRFRCLQSEPKCVATVTSPVLVSGTIAGAKRIQLMDVEDRTFSLLSLPAPCQDYQSTLRRSIADDRYFCYAPRTTNASHSSSSLKAESFTAALAPQ